MDLITLGDLALKIENVNKARFDCYNNKYQVEIYFIRGDGLIYEFDDKEDYDKHLKLFRKCEIIVTEGGI